MGTYERIQEENRRIKELQEFLKNGGKLEEPELPPRPDTQVDPLALERE